VELETVPVFLFGTGGLRMMSQEDQVKLLSSLRAMMRQWFPEFRFEKPWAAAIPIRAEAVFDWLAVQQTLRIQQDYGQAFQYFHSPSNGLAGEGKLLPYSPAHTLGIIDIGGASVEIAFEPDRSFREGSWNSTGTQLFSSKGDGLSHVRYLGMSTQLYARGYDGFGHNAIADRFMDQLIASAYNDGARIHTKGGVLQVKNPCMLKGTSRIGLARNQTVEFQGKVHLNGIQRISITKASS
jgi:hypothetical protein